MTERRKKKRNIEIDYLETLFYHGLEEFEEKIDRISESKGTKDSWLTKIFNQFSQKYEKDDPLIESDLDGIDPPILDETWGLGISSDGMSNSTIGKTLSLKKSENSTIKDDCRIDFWRCISTVIENSLHYLDNPDGYYGLARKTFFKMAFHGSRSNVWNGLMSVPEAREVKKCITYHEECSSYAVIREEAMKSLDPADDDYDKFIKLHQDTPGKFDKKKEEKLTNHKNKRIIVNPEYVQSLDTSDGSKENDE